MSTAVQITMSIRCASVSSRASVSQPIRSVMPGCVAPLGLGVVTPNVARRQSLLTVAALPDKEKTLTREDEPEEYWVSKAEKDGKSPMQDPLAIIGVVSIFLPFVLLLIAAALGLVDLSPRV